MLSELRIYFSKYADYAWRICGTKNYAQVMIEPGGEIENHQILELCKKFGARSFISCVHSDLMGGYCLMIEFYK